MNNNPKYDDSEKGGFSYLEKLALVAQGNMDPKEIGMVSADEAIMEITGAKKTLPFLGDWITFEASVVPVAIRAQWALQELKIKPNDAAQWKADWSEQHKSEWQIQSIMRSGNVQAQADQAFTDPILGFAEMMRKAATLLELRYEQLKKENPDQPFKTRDDLAAEESQRAVTATEEPQNAQPPEN